MSANELMHKAMELSPTDRAELARKLIQSLDPDTPDPDAEQAWEAEIERRLQSVDRGETKLIDWRDSVQRARESLRKGTTP